MRPTTVATVALLTLALLLPLILAPAAEAATSKVLTIDTGSARPQSAFKAFDSDPLKVFDFDGDGKLEIIAQNDNRFVYVFDSRTGALLAELTTRYPSGWGARPLNGPEAAIMVEGGAPKLIVANSAAYITSFRFDHAEGGKFVFVKEWDRRLSDCHSNPGMDAKPVFADLDRDGSLEILGQTEENGVYALRANGQLLWKRCIGGGNAEPGVGDTDKDGWPEAVFVNDGGTITVVNGRTGSTKWTFWTGNPKYGLGSASMPIGPAVGQLDGQGGDDVVVGTRDNHDCVNFDNNHAALFAVSGWGSLLWMRRENTSNPLTYTHAIIADVDNNGQKDVLWADWNTQGHKSFTGECGNWEQTGPANFYRYDAAGNLRWRTSLATFWNNKDLALADVDGDGVQEVLANGPNGGHDGIWYLNSRTGAKETFVSTFPWKVTRGPIVEDLWGEGSMQWVVPVYAYGSGTSGGAILVFDTGQPFDAMWPHLDYKSAGGGIAPPPPPSGDTFSATFTIKSPNSWWQEVAVRPDDGRALERVQVRVAGGDWMPMTLRSWGAWATSVHSPGGSKVEFLATDRSGGQSQSLPFTWLDGTLTKGSTAPTLPDPEPTPFTAGFEVGKVNEWWVEVAVRTTDPLQSVEAQVNGGAWRSLDETSWGTWAKSFFVAKGSQVVFRATNAFDQVATSPAFAWLDGSSGFSATFAPTSTTNNWWVETKVTSSAIITGVDTRVDGGSWTALAETDWHTWAKSFFVPVGAKVEFRARNDLGNYATSPSFTWS